tara:strand:+ start:368 stop:649 length:282 start_codon:yes stop_codon:yes gene_type:complete
MGSYTQDMVGQLDGDQRRVLGLLEAIDYGCFDYDEPSKDENNVYCLTLGTNTKEEVEQYLVERKVVIESLPIQPFVLGLMSGTFDFLYDEGEK